MTKLGARGDVTVGDVSQLWTAMGLEPNRLDDLLELVSIATTTDATLPPPPPQPPKETETDEAKEEGGEPAKEQPPPPRYDPAIVVDWNKLLALAAGQLGDVNKVPFFFQNCLARRSRAPIKTFAHRQFKLVGRWPDSSHPTPSLSRPLCRVSLPLSPLSAFTGARSQAAAVPPLFILIKEGRRNDEHEKME